MLSSSSSSYRHSNDLKLDCLYEISYISDPDKFPLTDLLVINPYHAFHKTEKLIHYNSKELHGVGHET